MLSTMALSSVFLLALADSVAPLPDAKTVSGNIASNRLAMILLVKRIRVCLNQE
ncbi:hypothetical protein [Paraburkholderia sp. Ac-20347]|uniref:hypothetical protein n=1 Tax=Paraburkholderia sp. Ac-20347 TaxID=2703892 RepID=UPI00197F9E29|nr:hypothetical protein [Paraburkholderia sp. Ac-20347]MBN3808429.1 hypothetical protein [Paraburkholderia sp. Ac-20347]